MKIFRFSLLTLSLLAVLAASAGVLTVGNTVQVTTPDGMVQVEPLNDNIFQVNFWKNGQPVALNVSQAKAMKADQSNIRMSAGQTAVELISPTTRVSIDKLTGRVSFFDNQGNRLLSEKDGISADGLRKTVTLTPAGNEFFYGAGERGHSLTLNGDSLVMYNRQNYGYTAGDPRISQMNITMPWVISSRGYGILFDDYSKAGLQLTDSLITYSTESPRPLSYFFVNGDGSLAGATDQFTLLTGRQQLPPFWTLGYITSKYGYHNQAETLGAVDSLKTRGYPLDGIVLDLYWYGKETDMGRLEWNPQQWPDHKKMLADLKEKGVNTILISQPYINKIGALDNYNMLAAKGMLVKDSAGQVKDVTTWVGDAGMFDVSNPDTRRWLWNRYKTLTDDGVAAWWGDLGEPEVHPSGMVHANGETTEQYHNAYGNEWSRIIYEGFRSEYPDRRIMMLMRGGTAGLQRYNVFPWSTDVSRSWEGFQPQINIMLGSGLSGLAYMSSDVGGFAVDPKHPYDPELYVRWLQQGVFSPTLRTHAQDRPEPYHYPAQEPIIRHFIKMRYQWLPYNYTLAYENATAGLPFARPLNFRADNLDAKYANVSDEYLWGDEVLVAPVMKPGARSRKLLFPAGKWYSFDKPWLRTYAGGSEATVQAPLDYLPLFVRAGAFIPLCMDDIENTTQYNPARLTVRYFPSDSWTNYTLFDDNRVSPSSLDNGEYRLTTFSGKRDASSTMVEMRGEGSYPGAPQMQTVTLEIEDTRVRPKSVSLQGIPGVDAIEEAVSPKAIRQYGWYYDAAARKLIVKLTWNFSHAVVSVR